MGHEILLRTEKELQDLRLRKKTRCLTIRREGEENLERLSRKSREQGIGSEYIRETRKKKKRIKFFRKIIIK